MYDLDQKCRLVLHRSGIGIELNLLINLRIYCTFTTLFVALYKRAYITFLLLFI